jgi:hypothetical protein
MGNRANFVIVKDQDWQLYYSHWGGCRMLDALIGGPELALRHAASLRRCEKNEWCDPAWIRKRVFESFEDSPAGHIAQLAGLLAPIAPGFVVSPDALGDCGPRPTEPEWSRFRSACDLVRSADADAA